MIKAEGLRGHSQSGAGRVYKHDGSDDERLVEIKNAEKVHSLDASYLAGLWKRATMQGKQAEYLVHFDNGITVRAVIERG